MSVMCCVYVPEGIIMAADSRLTKTQSMAIPQTIIKDGKQIQNFIPKETTFTLTDNAQKVILIKKNKVGVSFCGNAIINGMTVADYIRKFEIDKINESDTTETTAQKLSECNISDETIFFVCGFDNDIPYVFTVQGKNVSRVNIETQQTPQEQILLNATQDPKESKPEVGRPEPVQQEDPTPVQQVFHFLPIVQYGTLWGGKQTAITKLVNLQPRLIANYSTMTLKDAIDFAEFLVDLTIKYERFSDEIQTCGGEIDILVITKDDSFWKQHKVYSPSK